MVTRGQYEECNILIICQIVRRIIINVILKLVYKTLKYLFNFTYDNICF